MREPASIQALRRGYADSLKSEAFSPGKCNGGHIWKATRPKVTEDSDGNYRPVQGTAEMSIIRFPTSLISTLELSEALDWNHVDLMKDARSVAEVAEMPSEWFRPATYRDENGAMQNSYNMTSSGLMMLLWNCSGSRELQRNCRMAMMAVMVVRAGSREAAEENYAKAISAAGFRPRPRFTRTRAGLGTDTDGRQTPSDPA
jgi:hypothetical protein